MNMSKLFSYVAVFCFANGLCHAIFIHETRPQIRNRRENSDECCPPPPPSYQQYGYRGPQYRHKYTTPMCCELPEILSVEEGSFEKCHELMCKPGYAQTYERHTHKHGDMKNNIKRFAAENQSDNSKEDNGTPPPPPSMDFFHDKNQCLLHCVFAESGLLTGDDLLNEDLLYQNKHMQTVANNTKWAATIDPVYRKCIAAAKEVNNQSQKLCKPGPSEYMKCMSRELFFNCPSDLWIDSAECDKFKNKLEKYPNLWAPYPPFHEPYSPFRKPYPPSREPYSTFHEHLSIQKANFHQINN